MTDDSLLRLAFPAFERKDITAAFDEREAFRRCRRVVVTEKRLRSGHDAARLSRKQVASKPARSLSSSGGICSRALDHFRRLAIPRRSAGVLRNHIWIDTTGNSKLGSSSPEVRPVLGRREWTSSYAPRPIGPSGSNLTLGTRGLRRR
jgi:hypothetical protein